MRERVKGEITPLSAEQSATPDEAGNGASLAIDLNLDTYSLTIPRPDGTIWLKVLLVKIHCVDQVIRYNGFDGPDLTWTCSENDCSGCLEDPVYCDSHTLTVSSEEAVSDLPPVAGCKYGDAVKLVSVSRDIMMREIAIIGKQGLLTLFISSFFAQLFFMKKRTAKVRACKFSY